MTDSTNAPSSNFSIGNADFDKLIDQCEAMYDQTSGDHFSETYGHLPTCGDRYETRDRLGAGGMKYVDKVFDVASERELAFASLREDVDVSYDEALLREARLTALLDHPNVISVHDVGLTDAKRVYFTMDLKPGKSLQAVLKTASASPEDFPLNERIRIMLQICDALAYAHAKQVVHLDIKPDNVQIGEFGEVMVCDWGLGKILNRDDNELDLIALEDLGQRAELLNALTGFGEIKGTPGYMAPEQIQADGIKDEQSDVYALGCLLYTLCMLRAPFTGERNTILEQTLRGEFATVDKHVPVSLSAVIRRAMAVEKAARYRSVLDLKKELSDFTEGYATSAENAGFGKEALLFLRRNRIPSLIALSSLLIIASLSFYYIDGLRKKNEILLRTTNELQQAKDIALESRALADNRRLQAESAKDEVLQSNARIEKMRKEQVHDLLHKVFYLQPARSMSTIESMLRSNHAIYKRPQTLVRLQDCLLIQGKFDEMLAMQPKIGHPHKRRELASKYANKKRLTITDLSALMKDLVNNGDARQAVRVLIYDKDTAHGKRRDYLEPVLALLEALNPDWDSSQTEYLPDRGILRLRGKALNRLSDRSTYPYSGLQALHIQHLDVRGTNINDLLQISHLDLYSLDLRHTPASNLAQLQECTMLRELTVAPRQFSDTVLKRLPHTNIKIEP